MEAQATEGFDHGKPWRLISIIVLITLVLIGMVAWTSLQRLHISSVHTAALEQGESALLSLQRIHDGIDDFLLGNPNDNTQHVDALVKRIQASLLQIHKLSNHSLVGSGHASSPLHQTMRRARAILRELTALLDNRMRRLEASPGRPRALFTSDAPLHASFERMRHVIEQINLDLDAERQQAVRLSGWLQWASIVLIMLAGPCIVWLVLRYDTQRQRDFRAALEARDSLMREEQRYRNVFELSPVALWEKDFSAVKARVEALEEAGATNLAAYFRAHPEELRHCLDLVRVVDVNPAAVSLYGAPSREALLASHQQTLAEIAYDDFALELAALVRGEFKFERQTRRVMLDGTSRDFMLNMLLASDSVDWAHVLVALTDVTNLKQEERERQEDQTKLLHVQRLESLGVLAGGIAHDFNNLLTAIMGNASLAREYLPPSSQAIDYLGRVETASQRAADLCQQMLAYSGRGKFVVEPIDLSALVREMVDLLQVSIGKGIELRTQLASSLPTVDVDVAQLQQVVINLVTNASDAIGEGSGVITITTGELVADVVMHDGYGLSYELPAGDYLYLQVSDSGCGMDDKTRQRIFEPFFTTKFTGRGLGMAAVLGIVRGHHGGIQVFSEPGIGSTFKVTLPCSVSEGSEMPDTVGKTGADPLVWRGEGTVLVVDDEAGVREVAAEALERAGFQVLLASDGAEGLDIFRLRHHEIVAVLLDMTMPEMSGEHAFMEMRRIDPAARVVLSSGYSELDATRHIAGEMLAGFIQKPYQAQTLIRKFAEVLGPARLA